MTGKEKKKKKLGNFFVHNDKSIDKCTFLWMCRQGAREQESDELSIGGRGVRKLKKLSYTVMVSIFL